MTHLEYAKELLLAKTEQGQKIIALRNILIDGSYASWSEAAVIDAHTEFLFDDGICISLHVASICDERGIYEEYVNRLPYLMIKISGQKKVFRVSATAMTLSRPSGEYFLIEEELVNVEEMNDADILEHMMLGSFHIQTFNWVDAYRGSI